MQLSEQVTTLEQSKKLYNLWFKKESCFSYYRNWEIHPTLEWPYCLYPAYTASELMEYLPENIIIWKEKWEYRIKIYDNDEYFLSNKNITHALSYVIIHLLENKLINNDLRDCIECWEPVWHHECVKNCHSHCRIEL